MIEIRAIGGYSSVGKNMTAVRVNDSVYIFDMGLAIDKLVELQGEEEHTKAKKNYSRALLIDREVVANDNVLNDWAHMVEGIIITHGHLDHIGAVFYLANRYDAPIIASPFTMEVIKEIADVDKHKIENRMIVMAKNNTYEFHDKTILEFVNVTHSIPQTVLACLHTPEGKVVYANDFKFDPSPTLGKATKPERLKELAPVKAMIVDSLYSRTESKMPSESVARQMMEDILYGTEMNGAIVITTFSSHIARLKVIANCAEKLGRKLVFVGRSLAKYIRAAQNIQLVDFEDATVAAFPKQIEKALKEVQEHKDKYIVVTTGHQGEPNAQLAKIMKNKYPLHIDSGDTIIFSCTIIPVQENLDNRAALEAKIKERGARLFRDVHVSGHGGKEDLRDLITYTEPEQLIPTHGSEKFKSGLVVLAKEMKYDDKHIHVIDDGETINITKSE